MNKDYEIINILHSVFAVPFRHHPNIKVSEKTKAIYKGDEKIGYTFSLCYQPSTFKNILSFRLMPWSEIDDHKIIDLRIIARDFTIILDAEEDPIKLVRIDTNNKDLKKILYDQFPKTIDPLNIVEAIEFLFYIQDYHVIKARTALNRKKEASVVRNMFPVLEEVYIKIIKECDKSAHYLKRLVIMDYIEESGFYIESQMKKCLNILNH